ncbi:MAG TPA: hypothetical protein VKQ30_06190 [Ktedonobacterales bacterium]|nr:hypothetical protein [Ktedonobacterales bacterium]
MIRQTRSRRPGRWMLAIVVLVLALALAACGGRAGHAGTNGAAGGTTTQQYTGSGLSSDDQQIQSAIQSMDSAANAANADYSSQDSNTVP